MKIKYFQMVLLFQSLIFSGAEINLFGPRAGIGYMGSKTGSSLNKGIHSGFGWQIEVPYKSNKLTGYGEAGFLLLGAEQGIFYPTGWGFFGFRYEKIGFGAGPIINPMGIGIGFGPYFQMSIENLRIPIGINMEIIDNKYRFQTLIGFSFGS